MIAAALLGAVALLPASPGTSSAEDAGTRLAALLQPVVATAGPADGAPRVVAVHVQPETDARALAGVIQALGQAAPAHGFRVQGAPGVDTDPAHAVTVLRIFRRAERAVLEAKVVDAASGAVLGQPSVTLDAGLLPAEVPVPFPATDALVFRMSSAVAAALERGTGDPRLVRVAVLDFTPRGPGARSSRAGEALAIQFQRTLRSQFRVHVVERGDLSSVVQQQVMAQAAGTDLAVSLGGVADVQALVLGEVADAGDRFAVTVRVVRVKDGAVLDARAGTVPRPDVVSMADGMIELKDPAQAAFRSALLPGWGQYYLGRKARGVALACVAGALAATVLALGGASITTLATYAIINPVDGPRVPGTSAGPGALLTPSQFQAVALPMRLAGGTLAALAAVALLGGISTWLLGLADALLVNP